MRDRRFVAVHRGGPLERRDHAALAMLAADCAECVLPFFERYSKDHGRFALCAEADGGNTGVELRRRIGKLPAHLWDEVEDGAITRSGIFKMATKKGLSVAPSPRKNRLLEKRDG